EDIGEALRQRRSGSEHLIAALDQHYDYLEDTKQPPLELIVPSLMEMQVKDSVPGLVKQMMNHETRNEVLPLVVRAVVELGDASVVPALSAFLTLYKQDSTFAGDNFQALAVAADGIFRHGGVEGRELL